MTPIYGRSLARKVGLLAREADFCYTVLIPVLADVAHPQKAILYGSLFDSIVFRGIL